MSRSDILSTQYKAYRKLNRPLQIASKPILKVVIVDWGLTMWDSWDIHMSLMCRTTEVLGDPQPVISDLGLKYSRHFFSLL